MSLRLRFFKVPKHSSFNFKPRYYDEEKEELQERLKRVEDLKNGSVEAAKARLSGGFKRGFNQGNSQFRRKQVAQSNKILFFTMLTLGALTVYLLVRYMPGIANVLGN